MTLIAFVVRRFMVHLYVCFVIVAPLLLVVAQILMIFIEFRFISRFKH